MRNPRGFRAAGAAEQRRLNSLRRNDSRRNNQVVRLNSRKRGRRVAAALLLLGLSAVTGISLATVLTPLLAVEKVMISGLDRVSEDRVNNALSKLVGRPLPLVTEGEVAQLLSEFTVIESFSLESRPPHAVAVKIVERQPVVELDLAGTRYLFDAAGVQIAKAAPKDRYPLIVDVTNPQQDKRFAAAMKVLLALPFDLLGRVHAISANSDVDVTLRMDSAGGSLVIWGDGSEATLKAQVLAALAANYPETASVIFDVSAPNAPVVRY